MNYSWYKSVCAKRLHMPIRGVHHQMSLQSNMLNCLEQFAMLSQLLSDREQKSTVTKFYETRYKNINLITHCFESSWITEVVIMEGMFTINTKPLNCLKTMEEYGHFLIRRFIAPHFHRGSREVHMLFNNPGQMEDNPKQFEQARGTYHYQLIICVGFFLTMLKFHQNGTKHWNAACVNVD